MDVVEFITKYQKVLKNKIDDTSLSITNGGISSMEDFRARVGEIQGVSYALDELQTLLRKAKYTEDESNST